MIVINNNAEAQLFVDSSIFDNLFNETDKSEED